MPNYQEDKQHSTELNELMSSKPNGLLRYGYIFLITFSIVIVLLINSIQYPIAVKGNLEIIQTLPNTESNFGRFQARITINEENKSKIKIGQSVFVRFVKFPFVDRKAILGTVQFIKPADNKNGQVEISALFVVDNMSIKANEFSLSPGMSGEAQIEVQKMSVLKRVFMNSTDNLRIKKNE